MRAYGDNDAKVVIHVVDSEKKKKNVPDDHPLILTLHLKYFDGIWTCDGFEWSLPVDALPRLHESGQMMVDAIDEAAEK